MDKIINRYYKTVWLKRREDSKNTTEYSQTNYRNYLTSSKKKRVGANARILGPRGLDATKRSISKQIFECQSSRSQIRFGTQLQTFHKTCISRILLAKTWRTDRKISLESRIYICSPTKWIKREVYAISFIFVWTSFEHQVLVFCAIPNFHFFPVFRVQKLISNTTYRATSDYVQY